LKEIFGIIHNPAAGVIAKQNDTLPI
jgi:hypothetical protein